MAFKGESYIPLIIRVKPTEGDIWRVRDNGMLFGIPLKGGDFIEWTGAAWQLRPDLHYKLDDGSVEGVQDEAITTEFAPRESGSYAADTKRMYNGLLYIRNNTAGDDTEWVASHWTQTTVLSTLPTFEKPLVQNAATGRVSNNGSNLLVTGTNAWAEGNGTVLTTTCTEAISNTNVIPVATVMDVKPGMFANGSKITAVDADNLTITITDTISLAAHDYVTVLNGATGFFAHTEGSGTGADGIGAHAEGFQTFARANMSHAEGYTTEANGHSSHAEGYVTVAGDRAAHAEGGHTMANGEASHAGGIDSVATGRAAFATGKNCVAAHENSFAVGYYTFALGYNSVALGNTSNLIPDTFTVQSAEYSEEDAQYILTLSGAATNDWINREICYAWIDNQYSVWAEAVSGATNKIAVYPDDFPDGTTADSFIGMQVQLPETGALHEYDVVIGQRAVARGGASIAIGYKATALEDQSLAMNGGTTTGSNSIAIGSDAVATSPNSIAIGFGTKCGYRAGIALGYWNSDDNAPFVIGRGESDIARDDVFKIDSTNHVWIKNSQGTLVDLTAALITANIIG